MEEGKFIRHQPWTKNYKQLGNTEQPSTGYIISMVSPESYSHREHREHEQAVCMYSVYVCAHTHVCAHVTIIKEKEILN